MSGKVRKKEKRKRVIILLSTLSVLLMAVVLWNIYDRSGSKNISSQTNESTQTGEIVWNGNSYTYNEHLSNFLFLGIDNREKEAASVGHADAGQADALYLLSWDRVENAITVISIPRDTMTNIEAFGADGESLGKTEDHISISYSYGEGGHESCRLSKEAVSELFYGLPIQGYCSVNLDSIPVLAEAVGGVTVTVPNNSLEAVDEVFREGSQVKIDGENAETFVRYRDITISQSALERMERQKAFIQAYGEAVQEKFNENPDFIVDLYDSLEPYMVTNMRSDQFVQIMESLRKGGSYSEWVLPGEGIEGKSYDEYIVDDKALYEKIIETFYKEIS